MVIGNRSNAACTRKWEPAEGAVTGRMQFVLISTELGVTPWAAIKICINKFCSSVQSSGKMGEKAGISLLSYFLSHMPLIPHFWRISALSIVSLPLQYRGCTSFGQKTFVLLNCRLTAGRILINFHSACEILSPLHIYIAHSGVFLLTATSWITFTKSIFLNSK